MELRAEPGANGYLPHRVSRIAGKRDIPHAESGPDGGLSSRATHCEGSVATSRQFPALLQLPLRSFPRG